jgi:hypothetical protein
LRLGPINTELQILNEKANADLIDLAHPLLVNQKLKKALKQHTLNYKFEL